ncbi:MAG: DUF4176 domain-containing protein [Clostridia bacterium]|nr:DUF4176 domain-containing protein [Clostridia bacterium]
MKNLLPLGSVVLLKDGNKRLMIYGRLQRSKETGETYDYISCLYPEGVVDSTKAVLFNQEDISRLYFVGFQDPEEFAYRAKVKEYFETQAQQEQEEREQGEAEQS